MKEEKDNIVRMFKVTETQDVLLNKWIDAIKLIYGEVGTIEYRFSSSNGIGVSLTVYSETTKTEIDLTEYDKF